LDQNNWTFCESIDSVVESALQWIATVDTGWAYARLWKDLVWMALKRFT